jgi:soluble lytic murein transglycosylase-like protein
VADHMTKAAGAAANEAARNRFIDEGLAKAAAEKRAREHATDTKAVQDQLNGNSRLGKLDLGAGFTTRGATEMMRERADNAGLTDKEKSDLTAKLGKEYDEQHKKQVQLAKDEARRQAELATSTRQDMASFDRSMALFAASVNSFSGAITERQAWAEWAGAIGAASELGKGGADASREAWDNRYVGKTGTPGFHPEAAPQTRSSDDHSYDRVIAEASKRYGVDPLDLKKIMAHESRFNPDAQSAKGATGLMQVMPENAPRLGYNVSDLTDPVKNIDMGAHIWSDALKRQKGNKSAALMDYNAGPDRSHWNNAETQAYPDLVSAQNVSLQAFDPAVAAHPATFDDYATQSVGDIWNPKAKPQWTFEPQHGGPIQTETRGMGIDTHLQQQVAEMLANSIGHGMTVDQVMRGNVNKGDAEWGASNVYAGLRNKLIADSSVMQNQSMLNPDARATIQNDLRKTVSELASVERYMGDIVANARGEDARNLTLGQQRTQTIAPTINLTINAPGSAANNPQELARLIRRELGDHLQDLRSSNDSALKG